MIANQLKLLRPGKRSIRPLRPIFPIAFTRVRRQAGITDRGSVLVETALSLSVLFMFIFGIIEASLALYTFHFISYVAREGSRYAMVRGSSCASPMTGCKATSAQIQTYVQGLALPGINPNNMTVTATWPNGNENPGSPVKVNVVYAYQLSIPFLAISNFNMTSTSQAVISQ